MSSMKGLSLVLATSFMLSFSPGSSFASGVSVSILIVILYMFGSRTRVPITSRGLKYGRALSAVRLGMAALITSGVTPMQVSVNPRRPLLSKSVDRRESDAYIASSILSLASPRIPYLLGLNLSLMEPKPNRTTLSPSPVRPKVSTREEARDWSVDLATNIHLAKPVVYVEPRPSANKWNITAVGQPLWFHNPGSERHTSSDSSRGIIVSLDATRVETIYNTGEKTVRCAHSTPRPKNADPRAQSPDCGYIYQHPGNYTVRMTEVWQVRWRSGDQSGQIVTRRSSSKPLKVNELIGVLTQPGRR